MIFVLAQHHVTLKVKLLRGVDQQSHIELILLVVFFKIHDIIASKGLCQHLGPTIE